VRAAESCGLGEAKSDSFEAVPGHGAIATVEGRPLAIGNGRLLEREGVELDGLMPKAQSLAKGTAGRGDRSGHGRRRRERCSGARPG
jgi:Cu2+-exporting ATPase